MASQDDLSKTVSKATAEFMLAVDKLRQIESMDRTMIAAAFERQARKLIEEEFKPKLQEILRELAKSSMGGGSVPPATPSAGDGGDDGLPRRVERMEVKVDKLADDVSAIKVDVGAMKERLKHMPTNASMYLAGGAALATVLAVMAKGFGWL